MLKTIFYLLILLCFFPIDSNAQYISSTVEQVSSTSVLPGSINNPINRLKIEIGPNAVSLFAIFLSTANTNNPASNVDSLHVFYTGNNATFTSTNPFGTTLQNPFSNVMFTGNLPLTTGTNYFWIVTDLNDSAAVCDSIDFICYSIYLSGGTVTPAITDPPGEAIIGNCTTSFLDEPLTKFMVFPNPTSDNLFIQNNESTNTYFIKLFNTKGDIVFESFSTPSIVPVHHLSNGIYYLHIYNSELSLHQKITVQH